jgi:methionyl-tRNA formyltransferase
MRIVFFGATELGFRCCQQLIESGEEVAGIFTIPQEFRISYSNQPVRNVTFRDFEELAGAHDIPLMHVTTKMSDEQYVETLRNWRPDFGLVIGWYYMVPRVLRELFPRGVAGIHASLLPKYRGGAPLVWAIINGEEKAGVSFFYFDGGVDTGDLIAQQEFPVGRDDTIKTVYEKATRASLAVLRDYMPLLRRGNAPRTPQDHGAATQFPQRKPEDGLIDWGRSAEEIRNFIRAQTKPYPGAFTYIEGKKVVIWDADVTQEAPDLVGGGGSA